MRLISALRRALLCLPALFAFACLPALAAGQNSAQLQEGQVSAISGAAQAPIVTLLEIRLADMPAGPAQQLLAGLLDWPAEFSAACRSGKIRADSPLLGRSVLELAVQLGNTEAVELLLATTDSPPSGETLNGLLELAIPLAQPDMLHQLCGRGARLQPAMLPALRDLSERDPAALQRVLTICPQAADPAAATELLCGLLPLIDNTQLSALLADPPAWKFSATAAENCLAELLRVPGRMELLLGAGLDIAALGSSLPQPALPQVCGQYRRLLRGLESAPGQTADPGESSRRELAARTLALLQRLNATGSLRGSLDTRLPEFDSMSGEEYAVTTALPDPAYYRLLVKLGLDIRATDGDGNSALQLLAVQNLMNDAQLLELSGLGMDPLQQNYLQQSALTTAILNNRDGLVRDWLATARSPQPEALAALGRLPEFEQAARLAGLDAQGRSRALEKGMLLAGQSGRRESLQAVMAAGEAPLLQALVMLDMQAEIGRAFFDQKLLIHENISADSSLTIAVKRRQMDLLKFLLSMLPRDQHWIEEAQDQALCAAATLDDRRYMQALLDYGTPVERKGSGGLTPLVSACGAGRIDNALFLIGEGADPGRGLDYFALAGSGLPQSASAEEAETRRRLIHTLLSAVNPQRSGTALGWSGLPGADGEAAQADLLSALAGWDACTPQLLREAMALAMPESRMAAREQAVQMGRSELLAVLLEGSEPPLQSEALKLLGFCLQRGDGACLELLLQAGLPELDWEQLDSRLLGQLDAASVAR